MSSASVTLPESQQREYEARIIVDRLRREVYSQSDPSACSELLIELSKAELELEALEKERIAAHSGDSARGLIFDTAREATHRGLGTTGIEARVLLKLEHIPTGIYHLLDPAAHPLIECEVKATQAQTVSGRGGKRRVRVTSFIDGYSAKAVNTFEISAGQSYVFKQLPTLFADKIRDLTELTRGTLNVLVEDLDGKVEMHETKPVWLLARTSAPLAVKDPTTGGRLDMTRYLGAFVTPNAPSLMRFLRIAANYHPEKRLIGYQGDETRVKTQVQAIFDALKSEAHIVYINSLIDFNLDQSAASQRVRLPRESLADGEANCIDGTVLFASLLEGISLNPAIVLVPGHAFVAWETWRNSNMWHFLETTMIGTSNFDQACDSAEHTAAIYQKARQVRMYPLAELRVKFGVTPME